MVVYVVVSNVSRAFDPAIMYRAANAADIREARSPKKERQAMFKSTPEMRSTPAKLTAIPSQAREGMSPPENFTNSAAKIGCRATIAVPAATLVIRMERKKP